MRNRPRHKRTYDEIMAGLWRLIPEMMEDADRRDAIIALAEALMLERLPWLDVSQEKRATERRLEMGDTVTVKTHVEAALETKATQAYKEQTTIPDLLKKAERTPPLLREATKNLHFSPDHPEPDYTRLGTAMLLNAVPGLDAGRMVERELERVSRGYEGAPKKDGGRVNRRESIVLAAAVGRKIENAIAPHAGIGISA